TRSTTSRKPSRSSRFPASSSSRARKTPKRSSTALASCWEKEPSSAQQEFRTSARQRGATEGVSSRGGRYGPLSTEGPREGREACAFVLASRVPLPRVALRTRPVRYLCGAPLGPRSGDQSEVAPAAAKAPVGRIRKHARDLRFAVRAGIALHL